MKKQTEELILTLQAGPDNERRGAAYKLGKAKDPDAVPALIKAYADPDGTVRVNVLDALRAIGTLTGLGTKPRTTSLVADRFARRDWTMRTPVAVVYAGGGIASGRSGNDLLTGPFMGDLTIIATLERAFHAPGVRAVVFRVESPGGEVLASDLIDHAVQRLKRETGKCMIYAERPFGCRTHFCVAAGGPYSRKEVLDLIRRLEDVDRQLGGEGPRRIQAAIAEALEEIR